MIDKAVVGTRVDRASTDAPVLAIADPDAKPLPSLWVTTPIFDEGEQVGRRFGELYPNPAQDDEEGWDGLDFGGGYYDEGMEHQSPDELPLRIACFQAAETLYLHAALRGNDIAFLCLGYVYSYDRCQGNYQSWEGLSLFEDAEGNPSLDEKAYRCFAQAADAGYPEACYKLGDMLARGRGCAKDETLACQLYRRAFEGARGDRPVTWGSAALRLGSAYEYGNGVKQSFEEALRWYKQAQTGLELAVEGGDWYYEKALASAERGVKRAQQELLG